MSSTASTHYRNADALAGGNLATTLAELRAAGLSLRAICAELNDRHGIAVSAPTVSDWLRALPAGDAA